MSLVAIKNGELKIFKEMMKRGFAIGNGSETGQIVRELKRVNIKVHHGYVQETRKVIVALEHPFKARQKPRTRGASFTKTFFELQPE